MPTPELTDTQKLRMIPQLAEGIREMYTLLVTGDTRTGQPGMLETVRNIARDVEEIKACQKNYIELEKRIKEIEERHKIIDAQRERIDKQRKKWDAYQLAIFGTLIANIGGIIVNLLGIGK